MTEKDSLQTQGNVSKESSQSNQKSLSGARFSRPTSETDSKDNPVIDREKAIISSDGIDKESQKELGPSAFEGTERPYLARLFDMSSTEILQLGLRDSLAEVDSYILSLVNERNWVDTKDSYHRVLTELKLNLGIDESLQPLIALERLEKGVKLLRLQKLHRRRDVEISKQISKLNKNQ